MAARKKTSKNPASRGGKERSTGSYAHPEAGALLRPDVGTQAQFRKRKPPATWRYDPSRSPALDWAGKAERLSFDVPTLPLFVHERLSTAAILETLKGHTRDRQVDMFDLFGESDLPIHERLLKAYEHRNGWVNRLVLGDSLVVMNSLAGYEGLGGQVQTIYMDPPYAVKFGSNFQPFVRKRDVTHGDDEHMVREPEMVQAYRDTWELGIHSFLTYLRDRLLLARELLHPSGSIFVQMSDTNLHHVREVMDEVFGPECFVSQISFQTTSGFRTRTLATLGDFLLWYARDPERLKVRKLFEEQPAAPGEGNARWVLLPDGGYRGVSAAEKRGEAPLPEGARLYKPDNLQGQGASREPQPFESEGGQSAKETTGQSVGETTEQTPGQNAQETGGQAAGRSAGQPAAIVFGPENGAVSETLVFEAAREAYAKGYAHLYVIGFAVQPNARRLIEDCERAVGVPATYVQASMDLVMGDLLKNLRSSQIFSVCGLPDVRIRRVEAGVSTAPRTAGASAEAAARGVAEASAATTTGTPASTAGQGMPAEAAVPETLAAKAAGAPAAGRSYQVELLGLDVFDPVAMDSDHREGDDVPAWFLDTDYNGLCFRVYQAFFPRTSAWEGLKRSLRGKFEDSVWAHLSGTVSTPFQTGDHGQIAVKVVDDRGNELMVVKPLSEAEA